MTRVAHRILFILLTIQSCFITIHFGLAQKDFEVSPWMAGLLLCLAAATTLLVLALELQWQNVIVSGFVIVLVSGGLECIGRIVGLQFPRVSGADAFWPLPLIWLIAVLNARGVARLIVSRRQAIEHSGLWLIALTAILTGVFGLGSQSFVVGFGRVVQQAKDTGAFVVNFVASTATATLAIIFATPFLLNKHPAPSLPRTEPLGIWFLLNGLFVFTWSRRGEWALALVLLVTNGAIIQFARFSKSLRIPETR